MERLREVLRRLAFLFRRHRFDREMDEEMAFHLEMRTRRNAERGLTDEEARRAARRRFGNPVQLRERSRDAWGWLRLDTYTQDMRLAGRMLRRSPLFTVTAIAVLALGIGTNTAIFSLVNAVLFRPLPVERPADLRFIHHRTDEPGRNSYVRGVLYSHYLELASHNDIFSEMTARTGDRRRLRVNGDVQQARGEAVSWSYFDVLGIRPILGRTFTPEDDNPDRPAAVVVISYALWKGRFNGDPTVVGRTIDLDQPRFQTTRYYGAWKAYTIVGVVGPDFHGTLNPWERSEYWIGIEELASSVPPENRQWRDWREASSAVAIGRLRPGVSDERARTFVETLGQQLLAEANERAATAGRGSRYSFAMLDSPAVTLPFAYNVVPTRLAAALFAVAAMLLLIAAANLVGVLMARGVRRSSEIAVRLALGAGKVRLARQLLTESVLLALLGGAAGLLLARSMLTLFLAGLPARYSYWQHITLDVPIDVRVLLFTTAVCLIAGLLVGLAPALQALRTNLLARLGPGAAGTTRPVRARLRYWIVAPQVCLSLALLLAAGASVRSLLRTEMVEPGYDPEQVVLVHVELPEPPRDSSDEEYKARRAQLREINRRLLERARGLPDVRSASMALCVTGQLSPAGLAALHTSVIARAAYPRGIEHASAMSYVSPGYLETLGIPLLRGRDFDAHDTPDSPKVAIVDPVLARILWPGQDPLGKYVAQYSHAQPTTAPRWMEVIGVAGEVKPPPSDGRPNPSIYVLDGQDSSPMADTLVVRGYGNPARLIDALQRAVGEADVAAISSRSSLLTEELDSVMFPRRMAAAILALSGLIGLLLSSIGLYGVVSYSVAERVREIGIRTALGARKADIVRMIVGEGNKVALIGAAGGVALAVAAMRVTSTLVVSLPSIDAVTLGAVLVLAGTIVILACYVPARRATRVDPVEALRAE